MANPVQKIELEAPTEIYTKKVLAGNIEDVRLRLIDAVEHIGYNIIEDEPNIVARRGSKGWATWSMSANVLDVSTNLTIILKSVSENSTRATEGTTNLLDKEWTNGRKKEKVPISNRATTNDLDQ